jgi:transcriptional regulator GlxA family with amidase domain
MDIEILLFDGFDELDAMAPWEVFAGLAKVTDSVRASLVTLEGARSVRGDHGAVVTAHGAMSAHPDVLWVPGGGWLDRSPTGAWGLVQAGDVPRAIAARHASGTVLASVCTGALILAAAGVLAGHRATTNLHALDELRAFAGVTVVEARVVDDGDIVTGGAPACGLDLALHLVRRFVGPDVAAAAARELQYVVPAVAAYVG